MVDTNWNELARIERGEVHASMNLTSCCRSELYKLKVFFFVNKNLCIVFAHNCEFIALKWVSGWRDKHTQNENDQWLGENYMDTHEFK